MAALGTDAARKGAEFLRGPLEPGLQLVKGRSVILLDVVAAHAGNRGKRWTK